MSIRGSIPPIMLRTHYAMAGTDRSSLLRTHYAVAGTNKTAIVLRIRYDVSGTEMGYDGTRPWSMDACEFRCLGGQVRSARARAPRKRKGGWGRKIGGWEVEWRVG